MNIEIYINGRPAESYTQEEMEKINLQLTTNAMNAIGFVPVSSLSAEEMKQLKRGEQ